MGIHCCHSLGIVILAFANVMVSVNGLGLARITRNNLRASLRPIRPVALLDSDDFLRQAFIGGGKWLVLFCGTLHPENCSNVREEMALLSTTQGSLVSGMRLAEVKCSHEHQLCAQLGFSRLPAVTYYADGARDLTWVSDGHDQRQDFLRWIRLNFDNQTEFSWTAEGLLQWALHIPQRASDQLLHAFPNLRLTEVAAIATGIILLDVIVVAWVIVEGFQLWSKVPRKA